MSILRDKVRLYVCYCVTMYVEICHLTRNCAPPRQGVCVCLSVCLYVCLSVCLCTYKDTYIYIYADIRAGIHMHSCSRCGVKVLMPRSCSIQTCTYTHTHKHKHVLHTRARTNMYLHTYTHTHTDIHTHAVSAVV